MPVLVKFESGESAAIVFVDYMSRKAYYATGPEVPAEIMAGIFEDIVQQQEAMSPDVPLEAIQKVMSTKSNLGVKPLWKRTE